MEYIKTIWEHSHIDEPVLIYSELNSERWETRKVEIYKDGTFGYADKYKEYNGSGLGLIPFESVEEINKKNNIENGFEDKFFVERIEEELFLKIWNKYVQSNLPTIT